MSGAYDDDNEEDLVEGNEGQSAEISEVDIKKLLAQHKAEAETERARVKALEAELEDARQGRTRAESAQAAAVRQQFEAHEHAFNERLSGYAARAADLKRQIAEAHRDGNSDKWTDLTDELTSMRAEEIHERRQSEWLKSQKEQAIAQASAQQQQPDPLSNFSAKQKAWIRSHPEFMSDQKMRDWTSYAHQKAVVEHGVEIDSPEYFEIVDALVDEKYYGKKKPEAEARPVTRRTQRDASVFDEEDGEPEEPAPAPRRRQADGGLPVTRGTNGSAPAPRRAKGATLSREERDAADIALSDMPASGGPGVRTRYDAYAEALDRQRKNGMN